MEQEVDQDTLTKMLTSMADAFAAERQKTEPYKELFKSGSSHTGLLRELNRQMIGPVLDACNIYKERLGEGINKEQYYFLLALPLLVKIAEEDARKNDGLACCVDKAYFTLSEQLKALAST